MIRESLRIQASPEKVFYLSQDYSQRLAWDSFLKEARVIAPHFEADVGVRTFCRAWNGLGMETEYVSYKAPELTAVKMIRGPRLFREFAATWRFEKDGDACRVTFIYHVKTRPVFLEKLLIFFLRREMLRRLHDLKKFVENFPD